MKIARRGHDLSHHAEFAGHVFLREEEIDVDGWGIRLSDLIEVGARGDHQEKRNREG